MTRKKFSGAESLIKESRVKLDPYLDLGKCGITNLEELPELFNCTHLEVLILSNSWWDMVHGEVDSCNKGEDNIIDFIPEEISKLTKLEKLIIAGDFNGRWGISDISMLENLTSLYLLDISHNHIFDISKLAKLTKLYDLDISYNQLSDVGVLGNFTDLLYLGLSDNQLADISILEKLTRLKRLYLGNNILSDISILENLTSLEILYLNNNQITDISALEKLTGLQHLYLNYNQIRNIRFLEKHTELKHLDLRYNQINEIPRIIFELNLEVNMDIHGLGNGVFLYDNPMELPPLEIIYQGKKSVLDWFKATKKKLNEIKVILVGEPKAGKTSLLKRIKDDEFNINEPQTDGINIAHISFGECEMFKKQTSLHEITGHFWDFGGQEIMTATHQLFLTKRSIYVLVLDARNDTNIADQIRKWVRQVQATGGDSPIIVLANQIDINPGFGFQNQRELQEEFPQIKCFIEVSCGTCKNIELFKDILAELIPTADLFETNIDERWILLKEKLKEETEKNYFLNETRFFELCLQANLFNVQEQNNAIRFLHDLGLVLHFEELKTSQYYVLNPRWITYGIYQILTSKYAGKKKGIVKMEKLEYIVNEENKEKETSTNNDDFPIYYLPNQRDFLIKILHQFKLCYCMPDDSCFIIPDLLDANEPTHITEFIRSAEENIQFVYDYSYLPKSVMPNIMVDMYRFITYMWRTGCVVEYDKCKALISTNDRKIMIMVIGEHKAKRQCMSVIRSYIDTINNGLSVDPRSLIPLPGIKDAYADYKKLMIRERRGTSDYIYDEYGPSEKSFTISKLLEGIEELDRLKGIDEKIDKLTKQMHDHDEKTKVNQTILLAKWEELYKDFNPINKDDMIEAIKEMNDKQMELITTQLTIALNALNGAVDDKFEELYENLIAALKTADSTQTKLQLSIPFISLLGINLMTEVDIKALYKKHELKIFKLMGWV